MKDVKLLRRRWRTRAALVTVGILISLLTRSKSGASGLMLLTDTLFAISMAFFCWGLMCAVRNMGMFDSTVYGTKSLVRLVRNRWKPLPNEGDGFLQYVRSRPHSAGVPTTMLFAAAFGAMSVLVSLLAA